VTAKIYDPKLVAFFATPGSFGVTSRRGWFTGVGMAAESRSGINASLVTKIGLEELGGPRCLLERQRRKLLAT